MANDNKNIKRRLESENGESIETWHESAKRGEKQMKWRKRQRYGGGGNGVARAPRGAIMKIMANEMAKWRQR